MNNDHARRIVEECARLVELHARTMREEKATLTPERLSAIARVLIARFEHDGFAGLCSQPVAPAESNTESGHERLMAAAAEQAKILEWRAEGSKKSANATTVTTALLSNAAFTIRKMMDALAGPRPRPAAPAEHVAPAAWHCPNCGSTAVIDAPAPADLHSRTAAPAESKAMTDRIGAGREIPRGSILRCVDARDCELTAGEEYVVLGSHRSHGHLYYKVVGDDGRAHDYLHEMFVPAAPPSDGNSALLDILTRIQVRGNAAAYELAGKALEILHAHSRPAAPAEKLHARLQSQPATPAEGVPDMVAERGHLSQSAAFWFNSAHRQRNEGKQSNAFLCLVNAYNHLENLAFAQRDEIAELHSRPANAAASFDEIYSAIGQSDFSSHERYLVERAIEGIQKKFSILRRP